MRLCPIRSLKQYLEYTKSLRGDRKRLFIAYKKGYSKDIQASTVSAWIKRVILRAYEEAPRKVREEFYPHSHELRKLAVSWAALQQVSMDDIMDAGQWRCHNTFTSYYLCDLTCTQDDMLSLGPVVVVQQVVGKFK